MSAKKTLILEKALDLFNSRGVLQTSTRDIAEACGISQGNLTYHFRHKNDIIIALFRKLEEESDKKIGEASGPDFSFDIFIESLHANFLLLYKFRFIFLDFINILREVKYLKKEYNLLNQKRRMQFHGILNSLKEKKLTAENFTVEQKDTIYTVYNIYFNFWLTDAEILYNGREDNLLKHYERIALNMLIPYLNPRGKRLLNKGDKL